MSSFETYMDIDQIIRVILKPNPTNNKHHIVHTQIYKLNKTTYRISSDRLNVASSKIALNEKNIQYVVETIIF